MNKKRVAEVVRLQSTTLTAIWLITQGMKNGNTLAVCRRTGL